MTTPSGRPTVVRYQYMPPLSPEEYSELEASIRTHGVMVPILRDPSGVVIDGHHRLRIAESLGVDCPAEYLTDRPEAEMRTLAFELNLNRRHLTRDQRRDLVTESIKADPQLSSREHGRRTGVHHSTAESVRQSLSAGGEISHLTPRVGGDGKSYPPAMTDPFRSGTSTESTDDAGADSDRSASAPKSAPRPAGPVDRPGAVGDNQLLRIADELHRVTSRIEKLVVDDARNAQKIAIRLRPDLRRAVQIYQDLLDALPDTEDTP